MNNIGTTDDPKPNVIEDVNNNHEEECPICLVPGLSLLITPCGHKACKTCLNRVITTTRPSSATFAYQDTEESEDIITYTCPSKGRCPICRKLIDLFDLKVWEWNEGCDSYSNHDKYAYEKMPHVWNTPLAGLCFENKDRSMQVHFPTSKKELPSVRILEDDGTTSIEMEFQDGFHYFGKSQLFLGQIYHYQDEWRRYEKWEFIMQFSSDFRYVIHGAIIKTPLKCPLDGKWTFQHRFDPESNVKSQQLDDDEYAPLPITINSNQLEIKNYLFHIKLKDEKNKGIHIDWGDAKVNILKLEGDGVDLDEQPEGPNVGETILFRSNNPGLFKDFVLTRISKEEPSPFPSKIVPFGRNGELLIKQQVRESVKPSYNCQSPWGNVFIQFARVGLASYHFISMDGVGENGVYISYEHVLCSDWPPLDDGSPVPSRVPFVNHSYDPDTRTFRGTIPWLEKYGTCWNGHDSWKYEITFDSEFVCIISGEVSMGASYASSPSAERITTSRYGENLNYINAAIIERLECQSMEVEESERDNHIITEARKIATRLHDEGTPSQTLSAFAAILDGKQIDYNI